MSAAGTLKSERHDDVSHTPSSFTVRKKGKLKWTYAVPELLARPSTGLV